ncbi:MAG TPA: nucleotidyltransferase family protein [Candidatus Binataceae bacterium]|nr:nucleotidyltransferase family protein [Candidatus Binataceae bacterium]
MSERANGQDGDRTRQVGSLGEYLTHNRVIAEILQKAPSLAMANWYLGAGCVAQTVWNVLHGFEPTFGIMDYDLVYHDTADLSLEAQTRCQGRADEFFAHLRATVEVQNEARVHLWYAEHFGYEIAPYESVEAAINSWPTTATCVGVRTASAGGLHVYAPFGLTDLFNMIVRPNKLQTTKELYEAKTERWTRLWPKLQRLPWD